MKAFCLLHKHRRNFYLKCLLKSARTAKYNRANEKTMIAVVPTAIKIVAMEATNPVVTKMVNPISANPAKIAVKYRNIK